MTDDPLAAIRRELERALGGKQRGTLDEVQSALDGVMQSYNLRPQRELGGRSPNDVHRLLSADWTSPDSAIRISSGLSLAELESAARLHDARALLETIADPANAKLTPKGNLSRAAVAQFRERATAYAAEREQSFPLVSVRNEEEHGPLHFTRILLQLARLVAPRKGTIVRTKAGERLSSESHAGELYATLLRTQFRTFNLAYLDGADEFPEFQPTIGFTFAQFGRLDTEWYRAEDLVPRVLLPSVRDGAPQDEIIDLPALMLTTRFLLPLVAFGLAERRESPDSRLSYRALFRRAALWERVVTAS